VQRPAILVIHDGELAELARVVGGLGVEVHERVGPPTEPDRAWGWDLVLGSPRRLIELETGTGRPAARIAAFAGDSRTARAMLARSGIRLLVRLPVHPAALRLLVLHALYRGPERRRTPRASIGAAVRIRSGLRRGTAILADLTTRGCRIITTEQLGQGRRLSLVIPAELAGGGRALSLCGVASRVTGIDPRMPGVQTVVILFEGVSARDGRRLAEVVAAHAAGPALCPPGAGVPLADPTAWPDRPVLPAAPGDLPVDEVEVPGTSSGERRKGPRRAFVDPVLALDAAATRVLLGRDLSAGGMRIEPEPELRVGDELRLALHLGVRSDPLVVAARVDRDDGAQGFVLVFHTLEPAAREELERMLSLLPMVEMPDSGEEMGGLVLSEILERCAAGAPAA
jgi:hypothetical protein